MARRNLLLIGVVFCYSLAAFGQDSDVLINETIFKMVQSGIPSATIIQTIADARRVDFRFLPYDLQAFAYYKVPDNVFKAMAAKDKGRPIPGLQAEAPVQASIKPIPRAQPTASSAVTTPNRGHFAPRLRWLPSAFSGVFKGMAAFEWKGYANPYLLTPSAPTSSGYTPLPVVTFPTTPMSTTGTVTHIGNYGYYDSDGVTGTSNRIGNYTFYNFSNGLNGTSNRIGNYTFQNWSDGVTGTGNRIGNYNFYNWSDGSSATQNRIGNTTFTNFNSGKTCTTQRIGTYSYTNCN